MGITGVTKGWELKVLVVISRGDLELWFHISETYGAVIPWRHLNNVRPFKVYLFWNTKPLHIIVYNFS